MKTPPPPAHAFTIFAKTRPVFHEIAEIKLMPWDELFDKRFDPPLSLRLFISHGEEIKTTRPYNLPEVEVLKKKLLDASIPKAQRVKIQEKILKIHKGFQSQLEQDRMADAKRVEDLQRAAQQEIDAYELWLATDPAGIAAAEQDAAYLRFHEEQRLAEQKAVDEENARRHAERQALGRAELKDAIGLELTRPLDFSKKDIDAETIQQALEWVRSAVKNFSTLNAVLFGAPRTGKTRALANACLEAAAEVGVEDVAWTTAVEFAGICSEVGTPHRDQALRRLHELAEAEYLFFDDLGAMAFTDARTSRFFTLIDARYRNRKPTYLSTNYTTARLKTLIAKHGKDDDPDAAIRILGRIYGTPHEALAEVFHFKRPTHQKP